MLVSRYLTVLVTCRKCQNFNNIYKIYVGTGDNKSPIKLFITIATLNGKSNCNKDDLLSIIIY